MNEGDLEMQPRSPKGHGVAMPRTRVITDIVGGYRKQSEEINIHENGLAGVDPRTVGWDQIAGIVKTVSLEHAFSGERLGSKWL